MSCLAQTPRLAPVFPGDDWLQATPASQGVDAAQLDQAAAYLADQAGSDGVRELVVIRRGCLISQGDQADKVHGVWSLTKSFTSTALGLLIADGRCALDTPVHTVLPEMAAHYGAVTLRHFTTMTSGYRALGDEPAGTYKHGPSRTPFDPSPEPLFAPGTAFAYWDSAMNQFAHALTRLAGEPLDELLQRCILDPIGIDRQAWHWGDLGERDGLRIVNGSGNHTRMNISARALARVGQLYLHQGCWAGRQLVPPAWVQAAIAAQVPASLPLKGYIQHGPGTYGFNWWVNGIGPDGARAWPSAPVGTFNASGFNNNDLFVIPEWDMVIVRLGLDENERAISNAAYDRFLGMIGAALI